MASISLSTPLSHNPPAVFRFSCDLQAQPTAAVFLHNRKPLTPSLKCSLSSFRHRTIASAASRKFPRLPISPLSAQTPASAIRDAEADVMRLLLTERIVFLGSGINDQVADSIIGQLLLLDAQDSTKDIRLFINSPGGEHSATMAIYDVVRLVRADVSTIALGISASTSSLILGGGTKGKRFAMPNTRIMIHQPLGGAGGDVIDVEIQAEEIMNTKKSIIQTISEFTGRSHEQVEKDIDRDRYMSPIEGVEYGIIDGVIDRDNIIPIMPVPEKVKSSVFNFMEVMDDPKKYLVPEIPDDEIY